MTGDNKIVDCCCLKDSHLPDNLSSNLSSNPPAETPTTSSTARVISLDRIYPLVKNTEGEFRAQHSVEFVKGTDLRAVVGDIVSIESPPGQDIPLITAIQPRGHTLIRRTVVESMSEGSGKHNEQILATNIDIVLVMVALSNLCLDLNYLERQLVMAHDSGAEVALVLGKADQSKRLDKDIAAANSVAFGCPVIAFSATTGEGIEQVHELVAGGRIGVLLGRSGVGKSTLINKLVGTDLLETNPVRSKDRAGRHTTVARRMIFLDEHEQKGDGSFLSWQNKTEMNRPLFVLSALGSAIIDTPGLRSVGLYDAWHGLAAAFPEITELAADCHYRDCSHTSEPGCKVIEAVQKGELSERRLASYVEIAIEVKG